ncbi:Uncharacterised protein [Bacillus tequilensis]|nr:Uncharacterised protein [Bacillus tequilensis]
MKWRTHRCPPFLYFQMLWERFWVNGPDLYDSFLGIHDFAIIPFLKNDKLFTDYYFGRGPALKTSNLKY